MILSAPSQPLDEQVAQITHYELAIAQADCAATNYWWLGIAYLLAGDEAEAQAAWFAPIANADSEEIAILTAELTATLHQAAQQQADLQNYPAALLIRQHLQEIDPTQLENILALVLLSDHCGQLTPDCLQDWGLETALAQHLEPEIDRDLLAAAFRKLLGVIEKDNVAVIMDCLNYSKSPAPLLAEAQELAVKLCRKRIYVVAIPILQKCLSLLPNNYPNNYYLLHELADAYLQQGQERAAIRSAEQAYHHAQAGSLVQKIKSGYVLIGVLVKTSEFQAVYDLIEEYRALLYQVITAGETSAIAESGIPELLLAFPLFFFPYVEDQPAQTHFYLHLAGKIIQESLQKRPSLTASGAITPRALPANLVKPAGVLRIGYIASTLYGHSVGWLSRWLWQYHDPEQFQVFTYCVGLEDNDPVNQQWFQQKSTVTHYLPVHVDQIVAQIQQDQIDILVDLDSLTSIATYTVMAHRSAPVQVTWLGWDASGAPEVDYFIADPYVLPADAQDYYSAKIWRLPQTYVAVDGFEVGTPTIRRETLGIPATAVVYYSAQVGYKLHPDTVRLQLEIIRQVPDSYLLVKARTNDTAVGNFYRQMAAEVGVDFHRLRFLGKDSDEVTHRANLQIADVMLDSFPYNGATTTLETLWLGIPLVTRVGQQFAARNSYTFMLNAGLTEGIAWTADEYVEWGVRYGTNAELRQQIAGKLLDARSTAPIWNAQQFTQDMERAYREMWEHSRKNQ